MLERYRPEMFDTVNALAKRMHDEGTFKGNGWNPEKLRIILAQPNTVCILIRDEDGAYYGGIIGAVFEHFFSDDLVAGDMGLFIVPEKRGASAAVKLIRAFEDWARSVGAKEVHLGQTTGVEIDRTRKLYESLGYTVVGFASRKEL